MAAIEFQVGWRWQDEDNTMIKFDYHSATTAPRAINKFMKEMEQEYGNARSDIRVMSVYPKDGF